MVIFLCPYKVISKLCLCPNLQSCWIGHTLVASFYLNHFCKDLISTYSHIVRYWRLKLQHINFGGITQPIKKPYLIHGPAVLWDRKLKGKAWGQRQTPLLQLCLLPHHGVLIPAAVLSTSFLYGTHTYYGSHESCSVAGLLETTQSSVKGTHA